MSSCIVYGCTNNSSNVDCTIQYYYFPKHPLLAQQWVAACWRSDSIDLDSAQICSIHFDNSCFTSEYKMDYLGNYTKVLKYDAVPNLYLPNPQPPIIIKTVEDTNSVTTNHINSTDIKEIMVYEVQTLPVTAFDTSLKNYIAINTDQSLNLNTKIRKNEDNEKYKHVTNKAQLQQIINNNSMLEQNCKDYRISLKQLREKIRNKQNQIQYLNEELRKTAQLIDSAYINSMSIAEQKNVLSKVFSESQIKIISGKKKIYWSNDDMAIGYTIRHLSNKRCYMYLSKNLNIPLPALSSIKRWSTLKKNEFDNVVKKEDSKFIDDDTE